MIYLNMILSLFLFSFVYSLHYSGYYYTSHALLNDGPQASNQPGKYDFAAETGEFYCVAQGATSAKRTQVYRWNGITYQSIQNLTYGTSPKTCCLSDDGTYLISTVFTYGSVLYKFDSNTNLFSQIDEALDNQIKLAGISGDGKVVITITYVSSTSLTISIFQNNGISLTLQSTFTVTNSLPLSISISYDGSFYAVSFGGNANLKFFDRYSTTPLQDLNSSGYYLSKITKQENLKFTVYSQQSYVRTLFKSRDQNVISSIYTFLNSSIISASIYPNGEGFVIYTGSSFKFYNFSCLENGFIEEINLLQGVSNPASSVRREVKMVISNDFSKLFIASSGALVYFLCDLSCQSCSKPNYCQFCRLGFTNNRLGNCSCSKSLSRTKIYCIDCTISHCLTCETENVCYQCQNGYNLVQNQCYKQDNQQTLILLGLILAFTLLLALISIVIMGSKIAKKIIQLKNDKIHSKSMQLDNQNTQNDLTEQHKKNNISTVQGIRNVGAFLKQPVDTFLTKEKIQSQIEVLQYDDCH